MNFENLGLNRPITNTLAAQGYAEPTPIQQKAIPPILKGRDVVGLAQTGTGKTAAFMLPLLQRLAAARPAGKHRPVRVLVLTPTRELAGQIHKAVRDYGRKLPLSSACITGGVSPGPQRKALARGVDILIATPGRLLDLVAQKALRLDHVESLVLDEADHMLDIGFMPAIRRILALVPEERQTLLFSATMPKEIRALAEASLKGPVELSVTPQATTAERVEQFLMHLPQAGKPEAMLALARENPGKRIIVFTRTKHGADRVVRRLGKDGISAAAIHGNKSQGQRERALAGFRNGSCPVLIATDIAARGIDVRDVELVVNFELPNVAETYIHRVGRTARAGAAGRAISFCAPDERPTLRGIERLIKRQITVLDPPEGIAAAVMPAGLDKAATRPAPRKQHANRRKGPPRRRRTRKPAAKAA